MRWMGITLVALLGGCASYVAPGRAAPMAALGITPAEQRFGTDDVLKQAMEKKPLASFPASIGVVRVQSPGYRSYTATGWGAGRYSIVTSRDVEADADVEKLSKLPMLRQIAPLNRLVLGDKLESDEELRKGAARLHADMVLIYTLDTTFAEANRTTPLSVITLGIGPTKRMRVNCTASAALLDTRSGYVYGLAEASRHHEELQNAWKTADEVDLTRRDVESKAFAALVDSLQNTWGGVVKEYAIANATGASTTQYPTMSTP